MPRKSAKYRKKKSKREGPNCRLIKTPITGLGIYFDIFSRGFQKHSIFWFRGNADSTWKLTPSALRYKTPSKRQKALDLLSDFKRYGEIKLDNPPPHDQQLKWIQLARHYGLPTRLLDWTKNAAVALYNACLEAKDEKGKLMDGAVYILNPVDLNREMGAKYARVMDPNQDTRIIKKYFKLGGKREESGLKTIAIDPVWNSDRIMLQQGVFTLHGSKKFSLDNKQVPSLVCVIIDADGKEKLRRELECVGINEMAIYPEPEHMCNYLKWRDKLL